MSTEPLRPADQTQEEVTLRVQVKIASDRLTASVRAPESKDAPALTIEDVEQALSKAGVTFGLKEDLIKEIVERGFSEEYVQVAAGEPPTPGVNGEIEFLFEVAPDHTPKSDETGHIDYHEVNFLQGAIEGQVLARRTPPVDGSPGMGVDAAPVSASMGKDRRLPQGKNTKISEDNLELISEAAGVIVFAQNQVHVRDVLKINADVDFAQGNVRSPGCVHINGDVKAGFKVHADGDIEIKGNVEDAEVISKGNILIKGGFSGRGDGLVQADGDVTITRVEGEKVVAGHNINIGSDALNAFLSAGSGIFVRSEKGHLYGGEAVADKEIVAPTIGSEAWTPTVLKVGGGDKLQAELKEIDVETKRLNESVDKIETSLDQFLKLEMSGKLPEESKAALKKLKQFKRDLPENLEELSKRKAKIEAQLADIRGANIVATTRLYPGVKACFGIVYLDIPEERGPTRLSCESGRVLHEPYTPKK